MSGEVEGVQNVVSGSSEMRGSTRPDTPISLPYAFVVEKAREAAIALILEPEIDYDPSRYDD